LEALGNPEVPELISTLVVFLNRRKGQPGEAWDAREVIGEVERGDGSSFLFSTMLTGSYSITRPATDESARYQGWGTALKPAWEPVVVGVKP
jgi:hypothetical protein